jgi:hypothetical protein
MPENSGTIEDLSSGLLKVLEPLRAQSQPENILSFLRELGVSFPDGLKARPGFTNAISAVISLTGELPPLISGLSAAVQAKDYGKITELVVKAVDIIRRSVTCFEALATEINNAAVSFPGQVLASDIQTFATELPQKLLSWLIVTYLEGYQPIWLRVLHLLGIVQFEFVSGADTEFGKASFTSKKINFPAFQQLFQDPAAHFSNIYRWGKPDFDGTKILEQISIWADHFYIPNKNQLAGVDPFIKFPVGTLKPKLDTPEKGLQLLLESDLLKKINIQFPFFLKDTLLNLDIRSDLGNAARIVLLDGGKLELIPPSGTIKGDIGIGIKKVPPQGNAVILVFGQMDGTRFTVASLEVGLNVGASWDGTKAKGDYGFYVRLEKGEVVISLGGSDGFVGKIAPSELKMNTDLLIGYTGSRGIYFEGSGGIEIKFPLHITLGPIDIQGLTIALKIAQGLVLEASSAIKATLGPLTAVVENIGAQFRFEFKGDNKGNLGPVDLKPGFKPPNGVGLSINAGAVIGGGYLFFDYEKQEYAGVLELTIAGFISAKAIGLITTKMPDGSQGFSMLIIITAEFMPPFQLGYGFTLIGVGGLLGLNRTMLVDPLRNAVRTGAVNSIMFPQNVIANAPRIISDLKAIFPPYEGKFLIGPMAKMGWGTPTLISLSLGLIIEIPGNIAILGVLKIALHEERIPLVQIQVLFVGIIDFDKKMLSFDASLYESFILTMTLEGDMAVRLKWGDNPDFLITVGGFHPSFNPPPLSLPTMRRLAINILNTDIALIRVECYQAVTSNTVQFGAKAEIRLDLSVCKIEGYIGFDALFQFNPFYFIIEVAAGFKLSVVGMDLLTVRIRMSLEGPNPWRAKGTGSVSILFFEVSADFDITWGDEKNTSLPEITILPKFIEDIQKPASWNAFTSTSKNLLVSLRKLKETPDPLLILHPAGALVIQQKMLPLLAKIDKIGSTRINDVQKISIVRASSAGVDLQLTNVTEDFAVAQFQDMSDAEKLSRPSFQKLNGGVSLSMDGSVIKVGKFVRRQIAYEVTIIDKAPAKPLLKGLRLMQTDVLFAHFLNGNHVTQSVLSASYKKKLEPFADKVDLVREGYSVAFQSNNKAFDQGASFNSELEANTYLNEQIRKNPSMKKQLHIIPDFELQPS